jgi:stearoyl-CoA desaturase (Delta-9 desaturase)
MTLHAAAIPFFAVHVAALGVFLVPFRGDCLVAFGTSYLLGLFGIMAGYHRYFSHRSFKTGRAFQFVLAFLGTITGQKGVLWWSGHHRNHHRHSDTAEDVHSPLRGFWWSHVGWFLITRFDATPETQLHEFRNFPELRVLNRCWMLGPFVLCGAMLAAGGVSWLFWGGFLSIVAMWHATFCVNSLAHVWGSRRYETEDTSRNNFLIALFTLGEGWHNNHHHYQSAACQGFFWWEIDPTYYVLKLLSWLGIVWDLRRPPERVRSGVALTK